MGYLFPVLKMSLNGGNSGNTPAYADQARSLNKNDHRGTGSSNRTFMELDNLQGSEDNLHQETETHSVASHGSKDPIIDMLIPSAGEDFGNRIRVNIGDVEAESIQGLENTIIMTKTVEQSHHQY
jgi:hypothetical protein